MKKLPSYKNPPVVEVVFGSLFHPLGGLSVSHLGGFWESIRQEFPSVEETAPIVPVVEEEDATKQEDITDFSPRFWFATSDRCGLVQLQKDRVLYNWRKQEGSQDYPRFPNVKAEYLSILRGFRKYLNARKLEAPKPRQYELTYINHIYQGEGWDSYSEISKVFPDFAWRDKKRRFLPDYEALNWRTVFPLPASSGRLHTVLRSAKRRTDGRPLIVFELTARGFPGDDTERAMWRWFDMAHEWIVKGFTDLTDERVQQDIWKRER